MLLTTEVKCHCCGMSVNQNYGYCYCDNCDAIFYSCGCNNACPHCGKIVTSIHEKCHFIY